MNWSQALDLMCEVALIILESVGPIFKNNNLLVCCIIDMLVQHEYEDVHLFIRRWKTTKTNQITPWSL
jgi:hypothetical protein